MIKKDDRKTINGWAMYDWANSVYSLVITSSIFPIFYENVTDEYVNFLGRSFRNTSLLSYSISFSFLVVAIITPLLSGIADYSGSKKSFMRFFCYLGAAGCAGLYFFSPDNLEFGLLMSIIASIGFSGSLVFYNAFLPEIASRENQDRVSAKGFSLGYIGSIILLIFNLSMIMKPEIYGLGADSTPARISFLSVGIWWVVFAQFSFRRLPDNVFQRKVKGEYFYRGYLELRKVWFELLGSKKLKRYLLAFFVFNMGVQTVMYMAVSFAKNEISGMPDEGLILSILIIQIIAIAGAYFFSFLSSKVGNIKALAVSVIVWIGICFMAYIITTPNEFYLLAGTVGLVMGGIQALSRSTYSKFLPETIDHASYFSFYDVCDKIGIVIGTFIFGYIYELTGGLRNSALALASFFIIGLILMFFIPKKENFNFENSGVAEA